MTLPDDIRDDIRMILCDSYEAVQSMQAEITLAAGFRGMGHNILTEQAGKMRSQVRLMARAWDRVLSRIEAGAMDPAKDPYWEWMERHPDQVAAHRGMAIAIHAVRGIVAAGKDFAEVTDKLKEMGLSGNGDILLDYVHDPDAPIIL